MNSSAGTWKRSFFIDIMDDLQDDLCHHVISIKYGIKIALTDLYLLKGMKYENHIRIY